MATTKARPQLYAYLGLEKDGKLALYCSTGRLNPIGSRLEKGSPLPKSVKEFDGFINYNHDTPMDQVGALESLQEYFDKEASGKR